MPELPEVETICRGLMGVLAGQRILRVAVRRRDLRLPIPANFAKKLIGHTICRVWRRAKYLLLSLDDGTVVIGHLGMSGRLYVQTPALPALSASAHDHVVIETVGASDKIQRVIFNDPRRFGLLVLSSADALDKHDLLRDLGPEPLGTDFTAERLAATLRGRPRAPLKAALLDQTVVAGLGNIYVCEALHRARLSPERAAGTLAEKAAKADAARLVRAVRAVLRDALRAGGSTLRDYIQADGEVGSFQNHFRVYDRALERCPRSGCRGVIQRVVQAGRSTYFCPLCQV
jgi:formamidopyrimidine-DNA glycosylase